MKPLTLFVIVLFLVTACKKTPLYEVPIISVEKINQKKMEMVTGGMYKSLFEYTGGSYYKVDVNLLPEFQKYINEKGELLKARYLFCKKMNKRYDLGSALIFRDGLNYLQSMHNSPNNDKPFSIVIYGAWKSLEGSPLAGARKYIVYDLNKNPEDICIKLYNGYLFVNTHVATLKIPKEYFKASD